MTHPSEMFDLLGLAPGATEDEIKRAFRRVARECHPDLAGNDPNAAARFAKAREAYETLIDPQRREWAERQVYAQQARERQAETYRSAPPPGFASGGRGAPRRPRSPGAHFSHGASYTSRVADAFRDAFQGGIPPMGEGAPPGAGGSDEEWLDAQQYNRGRAPYSAPDAKDGRGPDVAIELQISESVARNGGRVQASWGRLRRLDGWVKGTSRGPGVTPATEHESLDIPAGVTDGDVLRFDGYGDAGHGGGAYGALVVKVRVGEWVPDGMSSAPRDDAVRGRPASPHGRGPSAGSSRRQTARPPPGDSRSGRVPPGDSRSAGLPPGERRPAGRRGEPAGSHILPISLAEAVLGTRLEMETPAGPVAFMVPPCTSSGATLRLRGKGTLRPDGTREDHVVQLRIVLPDALDARSRALIEEFARLNPETPER